MRLRTRNLHHQTTRSQLVADKLATVVFSATGLGVIAAVLGMMAFFFLTIVPLFDPVRLEGEHLQLAGPRQVTFRHDRNTPFLADVSERGEGCNVREINAAVLQASAQTSQWDDAGLASGGTAGALGTLGAGSLPAGAVLAERALVWSSTDPGAWPALSTSESETTGEGAAKFRCVGLDRSRVLIQDLSNPGRLAVIELGITRTFLSDVEVAALPAEQRDALERNRWTIFEGRFLSKASLEAPVAHLNASLVGLASLALPAESSPVPELQGVGRVLMRRWESGGSGGSATEGTGGASRQILAIEEPEKSRTLLLLFESKENLMTGAVEFQSRSFVLPGRTQELGIFAGGRSVLFVDTSGRATSSLWEDVWSRASDPATPASGTQANPLASETSQTEQTAQTADTVETIENPVAPSSPGAAVFKPLSLGEFKGSTGDIRGSVLAYGDNTLVVVDASGACAGYDVSYFLLNPEGLTDDRVPTRWEGQCHPLGEQLSEIVASPSQRLALIDSVSGSLYGVDLTTGDQVFSQGAPAAVAKVASRSLRFDRDGRYVTLGDPQIYALYQVQAEYLEGSLSRMFRKIHYEGYKEPSYSWQSAASTDEFEAKYSLWPLVWGTLKATLYAMIFAAPLGIFAAVYSSEILDRRTRNFVKPSIEMMASLPSVVLGYLAAVVLAPWIESNILGVILIGIVMPFSLYFFGNIVSRYSARHVSGRGLYASRRLLFMILAGFVVALASLLRLGQLLEGMAFGGDLKAFLAGGQGSASVLYGILFLPLVLVGLWSISLGRFGKIWRIFVFVAGPFLSFALGYAAQAGLGDSAFAVSGYSQRNALVICVAMGFAIIPIIYSLSEDALTAVPGSLRAGSLACGASVWQTTARVILPTAASGIFSALMVGFGRAIGETMIVVMATGNSPLMSINPFEGLRTLAANIAVELPEAPMGGTHYRILFFSGFLLFVLTFVMNTLAEIMRTRYRQRNKAL